MEKVYSTHTKILIKLNETLEELQQYALRHLRAIILVFQQALITNGHYPQKMKTKSKRGSNDMEQTKQRFLEQDRIAAECVRGCHYEHAERSICLVFIPTPCNIAEGISK